MIMCPLIGATKKIAEGSFPNVSNSCQLHLNHKSSLFTVGGKIPIENFAEMGGFCFRF